MRNNLIPNLKNLEKFLTHHIKLFTFVQVAVFASITAFVVGALLDGDWYKGIFLGIFVVVFYYSVSVINEMCKESLSKKKEGFFEPKLYAILVTSLFLLGIVTLISGIIFSYTVDYCKKGGFFYSEKRCELRDAENRIYEKYGDSSDGYDYDY